MGRASRTTRSSPRRDRAASKLDRQRKGAGRGDGTETPTGFSVGIPTDGSVHDRDGPVVEPNEMSAGIGLALVEFPSR
jgi:hypothetical protein